MTPSADYDVVIVGGGLAGLSLAARLATQPLCRTLVLEPRTAYPRDRTWSYWRLFDHPFAEAVSARWSAWEITERTKGGRRREVLGTSAALPYETIPADRLYAAAREIIAGAGNHLELRLGRSVRAIEENPDRVVVRTDDGQAVTAGLVFDSRPPPPAPAADLVQRFVGQEVVTDRPVFDPGRLTLMDFDVPQQAGAVHFLYVLPTSPTEALVEDTWLAPAGAELPDHRGAIRTYMQRRFGTAAYRVTFEETGAIPMSAGLQAADRAGRVIAIGTAGGAVKPSSGYGFLAIQRMADALAADIAAGRRPAPFQPRSPTARWMDSVFLTAMQRNPEDAPHIFRSLFAGCPAEPLIRFLNDVGTPTDILRVIAAMPKRVMIAAAASHILAR